MTLTIISQENLSDIVLAMNTRFDFDEVYSYLDRQTGEVLTDSSDYPLDILPDEEDENFEEAIAEFESCYLQISQGDSRDGYEDMEDFIETVQDKHLQDLLGVAIQGRGAFGRFKDVLRRSEYFLERNRWFAFSEEREYSRAVEWLTAEGFSIEKEK